MTPPEQDDPLHPDVSERSKQDPRITLVAHLDELRRRLGFCVATIVLTTCIGFWRADALIGWLKRPAGDLLPKLAFFSPTEALVAYVKVAVVFGIVLAMPVVLYQCWGFVRPALNWRERSYGLALVWWGSLLFVLGAEVAYGVFLPLFLRFLLTVGGPNLEPVISVSRYLSFVIGVIVSCGVLFELPLVVFVLSRLGILTAQFLRRSRSIAVIGLLMLAAVVTPTTDAISLILFTIPLLLLYEASIVVASFSARTPRERPSRANR